MLLSSLRLLLLAPLYASAASVPRATSRGTQNGAASDTGPDSFRESLTLRPLPDGRLSVLFEFVTEFDLKSNEHEQGGVSQSHHSLTPPSLLLPLEQNGVSEMTISFNSGWDQRRTSSAGPMCYESSGGGGEVRAWLDDPTSRRSEGKNHVKTDGGRTVEERWTAVTHALGGLFCATLGPAHSGENVRTFGGIYPPARGDSSNLTHFLLPHPESHLCTENLTPFLSLLPSKGQSGLSSLLAQPGIIFSWASQSEGIEVLMPRKPTPHGSSENTHDRGRWTGWWEGVVDLTAQPGANGKRDFSIEGIFRKRLPRMFPEASESIVRLIVEDGVRPEPKGPQEGRWVDGVWKDVIEWDLLDPALVGRDLKFGWDEDRFRYPRTIDSPAVTVTRTVVDKHASDGTFIIAISNNADVERAAVYSEVWPWWVKGWMSEVKLSVDDTMSSNLLRDLSYNPSTPPSISTTTVHFSLILPARSTLVLAIPFTKLTLKYTEHRPDAERGVELPSGVLTLLDTIGEVAWEDDDVASTTNLALNSSSEGRAGQTEGADLINPLSERKKVDPLRTNRRRIYTNRILLDVPTPDFSMPYNVIIMSSTVMAVFFGLMQGSLTRKWGWVEAPGSGDSDKTHKPDSTAQRSRVEAAGDHVEKE